jgi:anti-sigma factor ChrR (cupin superfamily)
MNPTLPDPHHPTSEELFAYRDGELTADRRTLIEAHVLACAQCSEQLDEMSAAEAELRRRPDGAGEEYFERMTESVMGRIGAPGSQASNYVEVPRVDRRRPDKADEDEPRRRLHLPWIGIAGSTAAAVAVVIIAVVLFRGQSEWIRAPRPAVLGEPRASARADSTLAKQSGSEEGQVLSGKAANGVAARDKTAMLKKKKKNDRPAAKSELEATPPALGSGAQEKAVVLKDQASRAGDVARQAPSAAQAPEVLGDRKIAAAPQAESFGSKPAAGAAAPGEAYAGLLRAYRLPPVWNPGVSTDAITRAEPNLRYLYQTGRAGADSARIRLYLAEAERARLTDPSNTAAVESISHHYRRAISLAGGDATLAATARRRLAEFEQEMTRARGAQPPG